MLLGKNDSGVRDQFLYYNDGELQAVRKGEWKLRLPGLKKLRTWTELDRGTQQIEIYNLESDPGETKNQAAENPDVVKRLTSLAKSAKRP